MLTEKVLQTIVINFDCTMHFYCFIMISDFMYSKSNRWIVNHFVTIDKPKFMLAVYHHGIISKMSFNLATTYFYWLQNLLNLQACWDSIHNLTVLYEYKPTFLGFRHNISHENNINNCKLHVQWKLVVVLTPFRWTGNKQERFRTLWTTYA